MRKAIITQEQADAIEDLLKDRTAESIVREKVNPLQGGFVYIDKLNHIIFTETELDTIIRALYIGYEVEPEFKIGDWVVVDGYSEDYDGKVLNITKIYKGALNLRYCKFSPSNDNSHNFCLDSLTKVRHATPEEIAQEKERRWWEGIGRCVRQFKEGDIVNIRAGGILHREVNYINHFSEVGVVEDYNMYRPTECELVCRVEDRKDVKE